MYINDPHFLNQDVDANQPDFFDKTISGNLFNFSFVEISHEVEEMKKAEKKVKDEKFFGTHVDEAGKTLKKIFKK